MNNLQPGIDTLIIVISTIGIFTFIIFPMINGIINAIKEKGETK